MNIKSEYQKLIDTPEWRAIRLEVLKRDRNCVLCGSVEDLTVHHRHYTRPLATGFFNPDNLITLCYSCHEVVTDHQRRLRYKKKNSWPSTNFIVTPLSTSAAKQVLGWPTTTTFEIPKITFNQKEKRKLS